MWATMISRVLYLKSVEKFFRNTDKLLKNYMFLCTFVPLIFAIIPFLGITPIKYGNYLLWCAQIDADGNDFHEFIENLFTLDIPIWLGVIISSYFYIKVLLYLKNQSSDMYKLFFHRLRMYPVVLFLSWIPLTIDKIYVQLYGYSFWLLLSQFFVTHSLGFTNAMVYGYYHGIGIKDLCKKRSSSISILSQSDQAEEDNRSDKEFESGYNQDSIVSEDTDKEMQNSHQNVMMVQPNF